RSAQRTLPLIQSSRRLKRNRMQGVGKAMNKYPQAAWTLLSVVLLAGGLDSHAAEPAAKVTTLRVPQGGIQPQVAVDDKGTVHLAYFHGDPRNGNLSYVRSTDGAKFSDPIPVNSHPDSAIAVGNIRGAHLAVGKNGRVHVAWMGSGKAEPKAPGNATPLLYSR